MASIIIDGALPETLPVREDGTQFPFALAWEDRAILAETRTELTAELIDGYAELPETEEGDTDALYARYRTAVQIANTLQQVLAANATEEGTFDPSTQSEDVLTTIFTDRSEKIDEITEWTNKDVPLVLVATEYAPYSTATKPTGNVLWVDPFTETTFLSTLSELGLVELFVNEQS
ncbi:hypothetical protein IV500_05515 [Paeniglutamicibacter antarcticus]|uniref:Uncharacterized protein n=1 Tax=Arthrobacter terrae TaxID=2935737 RepID=A0A931CQ05_9MICC|nr:hypothetical protein [Arthrobacter terrae]MBG0738879.1 hypothetical protein [Arthrobacter terrae]